VVTRGAMHTAPTGAAAQSGTTLWVGSTFRCSARDFARLGYLWLRRGSWGKRQLVPEEWMKQRLHASAPRRQRPVNYGYTFWIQDELSGVPADAFGSRGHNINDCYVIPSLGLVIARMGNDDPPREQRDAFVRDLIAGVVKAVT